MEISISRQETIPSGVAFTIHAASNKKQTTRVLIQKMFARKLDANNWYEKNKKPIATHLARIEEICKTS